jgi:hypothetical protein
MNLERAALLVATVFVFGHVYWMMRHRFKDRHDPRARLDLRPAPGARAATDAVITEVRVDAEFRRLKNLLAPEYAITLEFKPLEGLRGQVLIVPRTLGGEIRVDLARHSSFADVRHTLVHEITHILNAPFLEYRMASAGLDRSASEEVAWTVASEHSTEAVTVAIIRALAQDRSHT